MIEAARALSASGAGDSLARLAIAFSAMPLFGPSFAGRSNSTVSTPALVRCAAICAPMTPAPSTAALRMRKPRVGEDAAVIGFSDGARGGAINGAGGAGRASSRVAQPGGGEADQVLDGLLKMLLFADVALALDHAEARHGVGQRTGHEVDAPVQLGLAQVRQDR